MKYRFGFALAALLSLSACGGGDSSSSGSSNVINDNPQTPTQPTIPACTTTATTVTGIKGKSCTFSLPKFNNGETQTLVCNSTSGGSIVGKGSTINFGQISVFNGVTISCQ